MFQKSLYAACMLLVLLACGGSKQEPTCILPAEVELKPGDVVFRRGSGLTSHAVIYAEHDGVYSHTGIVVDSAGVPMIVHAVPGEPDFKGDPDRVKMDSPATFFSSIRAKRGEVRRHTNQQAAQRAAQEALKVYRRGTLFDHDYNDTDTTKMYCTELVMHAYNRAGAPLNDVESEPINVLFIHQRCVLPSALLQSRYLRPISQF